MDIFSDSGAGASQDELPSEETGEQKSFLKRIGFEIVRVRLAIFWIVYTPVGNRSSYVSSHQY